MAALPIGFRFAVTKDPVEQAPPGLGHQIIGAAKDGRLDELLGLCQEWVGHPEVINEKFNYMVRHEHDREINVDHEISTNSNQTYA